jgi:hypothetical protein
MMMVGRYAHAKQFNRHRRELRILRTRLGRLIRDIGRKIAGRQDIEAAFALPLARASQIRGQQQRQRGWKLYSIASLLQRQQCIALLEDCYPGIDAFLNQTRCQRETSETTSDYRDFLHRGQREARFWVCIAKEKFFFDQRMRKIECSDLLIPDSDAVVERANKKQGQPAHLEAV